MLKPSVIYCIVGAVHAAAGWMNRYLPRSRRAGAPTSPPLRLRLGRADVRLGRAQHRAGAHARSRDLGGGHVGLGPRQQDRLFLIQYATMTASAGAARQRQRVGGPRFLILFRPAPPTGARPGSAGCGSGCRSHGTPHWPPRVDAGIAELADALDAQRIHLRVVLRQQDGLDAADVGMDRHVIAGEIAR